MSDSLVNSKFISIKDIDSFNNEERRVILYLKSLQADSEKVSDLDIYVNFNAKEFGFIVERNSLYLELPPDVSDHVLKFELYKIDYLLKYPVARSIYGFWPGFYKYENMKSQFFYLIGLISLFTFSLIFSKNLIGFIVSVGLGFFILIYTVFLINLLPMSIYIRINSQCFNRVCINHSGGKYCTQCQIFLRKNPFILIGFPKIVSKDETNIIEPEFELFFKLLIFETNYIKDFKRIIYKFGLYDRHRLIDPFSIDITINKDKSLKNIIVAMFNLDLYLMKKNPRTQNSIPLFDIPRRGEQEARKFIKKYFTPYKIVEVMRKYKKEFTEIPSYLSEYEELDNITDKIKEIAKIKLKIISETDEETANELIKMINDSEFDNFYDEKL